MINLSNCLLFFFFSSFLAISATRAEDLEGSLQSIIIDDPSAPDIRFALIRTGKPELMLQKLDSNSLNFLKTLPMRTKIKISGKKTISGFDVVNVALSKSSGAARIADRKAVIVPGERTVLIIPFYHASPDNPVACDPELVKGFFAPEGAINKHYRENLEGKLSFKATLVEPVLVDAGGECTDASYSWRSTAQKYFADKGFNINNYNSIVLLAPKGVKCNSSSAWLGDGSITNYMHVIIHPSHCANPAAIGHELGHNLGWHHASSPTQEYGDFSDVMGGAMLTHSASPRKISGGVSKPNEIQTITGPGLYRIEGLIHKNSEVKILRWPLRNPAVLRNQTYKSLYVSYRSYEGMDADIPSIKDRMDRTHVHLWQDIVDGYTSIIGNLNDNEIVEVASNPISITQVSHSANGSLVCIKIDGVGDCSVEIAPPRLVKAFSYDSTPKIKLNASLTDESLPYVQSVSFSIDGKSPIIDNSSPYSACGDSPVDPCEALSTGLHQVSITAHAGVDGTGSSGPSLSKDFTKSGGPLPVTITSFMGTSGKSGVTLIWKTTGESKFDRFEVQSSSDARTWKQVASVKGTQSGSYGVTVVATSPVQYFRLKMIDLDASFAYSRILSVKTSVITILKPVQKIVQRYTSPRAK